MWVHSVDAADYAQFLWALFRDVAGGDPPSWRPADTCCFNAALAPEDEDEQDDDDKEEKAGARGKGSGPRAERAKSAKERRGAAKRIQASTRGRKATKERQEREQAAVKLQAARRGQATRRKAKPANGKPTVASEGPNLSAARQRTYADGGSERADYTNENLAFGSTQSRWQEGDDIVDGSRIGSDLLSWGHSGGGWGTGGAGPNAALGQHEGASAAQEPRHTPSSPPRNKLPDRTPPPAIAHPGGPFSSAPAAPTASSVMPSKSAPELPSLPRQRPASPVAAPGTPRATTPRVDVASFSPRGSPAQAPTLERQPSVYIPSATALESAHVPTGAAPYHTQHVMPASNWGRKDAAAPSHSSAWQEPWAARASYAAWTPPPPWPPPVAPCRLPFVTHTQAACGPFNASHGTSSSFFTAFQRNGSLSAAVAATASQREAVTHGVPDVTAWHHHRLLLETRAMVAAHTAARESAKIHAILARARGTPGTATAHRLRMVAADKLRRQASAG